ncbi:BTAD domain-containing putative transcriptional regulator [Amycolatopsis sp. NPDC051372]|uniref:BTAD domain-containing putative transcriptional regulator n=1 Tax=Amycolatopsis sp. NPDC051372 TaxID=3155669 RepID=UPI00343CE37C
MRTAPAPLRALGGALTLVTILCGPPAAFWTFRAALLDSWPDSFSDARRLLTEHDSGQVFLTFLVLIGLVSWLQLVAAIAVEAAGLLRGTALPRISGLGWARKIAAGALLLMFTGTAAATAAEQPPAPMAAIVAASMPAAEHAANTTGDYEVKPGDSLIRIATHELGDGNRYQEIFTLNRGKPQPDGETLRDVALVKPGWRLILPPRQSEKCVVHTDDTLSSIARDHLGDARRYRDLFTANLDQQQPSGHRLTDPDDIHPGDVLRLPAAIPPAAPQPTHATPPSVTPPASTPTAAPPSSALAPTLRPVAQPGSAAYDSDHGPLVVAGVAGLITAGILATAGTRRLVARRRLREGRGQPADPTAASRTEPHPHTEPPSLESLDNALRALAVNSADAGHKVPYVRAAWVGPSETWLEIEEPADPIPPFNAESSTPRRWVLDPGAPSDETAAETTAPYPLLVSLGENGNGDLAWVSLDRVGVLLLHGEDRRVRETVRAIANDLAVSPWSRHVIVSLVATEQQPDHLDCYDTLDDLLDDLERARSPHGRPADPHVVLSSQPLTADHLERLGGPAATGVAAIVAPAEPDVSIPGASEVDLDQAPTPIEPLGAELHLPRIAAKRAEQPVVQETSAPALSTRRATIAVSEALAPQLQLLGPVRLCGLDMDKVEGKKINRLTELAAFLALNPGAHAEEISRQMGTDAQPWSAATRQGYISRLRTWLGHDSAGDLYLPNVDAKQGGYRLSETLTTDWSRFRDLTRRGLDSEAGGLEHLQQALDLVGGMPLGNVPDNRYTWASWHQREMIDAIVDVAHTLAEHYLESGEIPAARRAATRGLRAEPVSEALFRDLLRIEYRVGNAAAVKATADKLSDISAALEIELEDETAALIRQSLNFG